MHESGQGNEAEQQVIAERCLADVDTLNRMRSPDGSFSEALLAEVHTDLLTATKEAAMPYAVSTVHQPLVEGEYLWLDQPLVDVARSGYRFHKDPAALERVEVEVNEALDVEANLQPGRIKIFLSPRMTRVDAPLEVAKQEHLADDDMVRIHMLDSDPETGAVRGKFMQSLLVRDIPLDAWVSMLNDPNNVFGRSMDIADNGSALPVLQAHKELELAEEQLPEGVISVVEAVVPYIADPITKQKVEVQLGLFRNNQQDMHETAVSTADRWLDFEVGLADSLHSGWATPVVERFIYQLQHDWGEETLALLQGHMTPEGILISRGLAIKLEEARQNTLWVSAGVVSGNQKLIDRLGKSTAQRIYDNEKFIQTMMRSGYSAAQIAAVDASNNRLVASSGAHTGGGCAGDARGDFGGKNKDKDGDLSSDLPTDEENSGNEEDKSDWKWKQGVCRIKNCPTRPDTTRVGPCDVCKRCQGCFDRRGEAPNYAPRGKTIAELAASILLSEEKELVNA